MRRALACVVLAASFAAGPRPTPADPEDGVRFNRDIRPILANACFQCHGPDPGGRKGKLRFDREEGFFGARDGGPTVLKGKPEDSPLYKRIVSKDPEEVMPPPKSHKVLKPAQKDSCAAGSPRARPGSRIGRSSSPRDPSSRSSAPRSGCGTRSTVSSSLNWRSAACNPPPRRTGGRLPGASAST